MSVGINSVLNVHNNSVNGLAGLTRDFSTGKKNGVDNPAAVYSSDAHRALAVETRRKALSAEKEMNVREARVAGLEQAKGLLEGAQEHAYNAGLLPDKPRDALIQSAEQAMKSALEFIGNFELDGTAIFKQGEFNPLIKAKPQPFGGNDKSIMFDNGLKDGTTLAINDIKVNFVSFGSTFDKQTQLELKDSSSAKEIFEITSGGKNVYKLGSGAANADFASNTNGSTISKKADIASLAADINEKLGQRGIGAYADGDKLVILGGKGIDIDVALSADAGTIIDKYTDASGNSVAPGSSPASTGFTKYNGPSHTTDTLAINLKQRVMSAGNDAVFSIEFDGKKLQVEQAQNGAALSGDKLVLAANTDPNEQLAKVQGAIKKIFGPNVGTTISNGTLYVRGLGNKTSELSIAAGAKAGLGADIAVLTSSGIQTVKDSTTVSLKAVNNVHDTQIVAAHDTWQSDPITVAICEKVGVGQVFSLEDQNGNTIFSLEIGGDKDEVAGNAVKLAASNNSEKQLQEKLHNLFSQNSNMKGAKELMSHLLENHGLVLAHVIDEQGSSIMVQGHAIHAQHGGKAFTLVANGDTNGPVQSVTSGFEGSAGHNRLFPNGQAITVDAQYTLNTGATTTALLSSNNTDSLQNFASAWNKFSSSSVGNSIGAGNTKLSSDGNNVLTAFGNVYSFRAVKGKLKVHGIDDGSFAPNVVRTTTASSSAPIGRTYAEGALGGGKSAASSLEINKGMMIDGNKISFAGMEWELSGAASGVDKVLVNDKSLRDSVASLVNKINESNLPFEARIDETNDGRVFLHINSKSSVNTQESLYIVNANNAVVGILRPDGGINDKMNLFGVIDNAASYGGAKFTVKPLDKNLKIDAELGGKVYEGMLNGQLSDPGARVVHFLPKVKGDGAFSLYIDNNDITKYSEFTQADADALANKLNEMASKTKIYTIFSMENLQNSEKGSLLEGATAELHATARKSPEDFKVNGAFADGNSVIISTTFGNFQSEQLPPSLSAGGKIVFTHNETGEKITVTLAKQDTKLDSDSLASAMKVFFSTANTGSVYGELSKRAENLDMTDIAEAVKSLKDMCDYIALKIVENNAQLDREGKVLSAIRAALDALERIQKSFVDLDPAKQTSEIADEQQKADAASAAFELMLRAAAKTQSGLLDTLRGAVR